MNARIAIPVLVALLPSLSQASPTRPDQDEDAPTLQGGRAIGRSPGAIAKDWLTMPDDTSTLSFSIGFITADDMAGQELKFTDVALTSIGASHALTDRFELSVGASFLGKQRSEMDEHIWQSAALSAAYSIGKRMGLTAAGSTGTLMGDQGMWFGGDIGIAARPALDRRKTLIFDLAVAGSTKSLAFQDLNETYTFGELRTSADIVFRAPYGGFAGWVGAEFGFPLFDTDDAKSMVRLSPQTRTNFHVGASVSYVENWDIFAKYSFIDRGDATDPTTQLPMLSGGFDQSQFILGVTRHFADDDDNDHHTPMNLAY